VRATLVLSVWRQRDNGGGSLEGDLVIEPPSKTFNAWLAFVLGIIVGSIGLIVALVIFEVFAKPELRLDVAVEAPSFADLNGPLQINIVVNNLYLEPLELDRLELYSFTPAFTIEQISPEPLRTVYDDQEYDYQFSIPPESTETLTLRTRAMKAGRHVIEFEVCSSYKYESCSVAIKVIRVE